MGGDKMLKQVTAWNSFSYDKSLGEFRNPFHDQHMAILLRVYCLTQDPYSSFF